MYEIAYAQSARKALKRLWRSGSFSQEQFQKLLSLFMTGEVLPKEFKDHQLQGDLSRFRECHIGFNLLVMYERIENDHTVVIENIGTHQELFGE